MKMNRRLYGILAACAAAFVAASGCAKQTNLEDIGTASAATGGPYGYGKFPQAWVDGGSGGGSVEVYLPPDKDFEAQRYDPATGAMIANVSSKRSPVIAANYAGIGDVEGARFAYSQAMFQAGLNAGLSLFDRVTAFQQVRYQQRVDMVPVQQAQSEARLNRIEANVDKLLNFLSNPPQPGQ